MQTQKKGRHSINDILEGNSPTPLYGKIIILIEGKMLLKLLLIAKSFNCYEIF